MDVTQKELAQILGISDRRIRQLSEEGFFQRGETTKKYNLGKSVQEYIRYKVEAETGDSKSVDYDKERAKHEKTKGEIAKLRLRKLRGELHEAADVADLVGGMLVEFRGRVLALPPKLAPMLLGMMDPNAIMEIVKRELRAVLEALAGYDPAAYQEDVTFEDEDDEPDEADMPG